MTEPAPSRQGTAPPDDWRARLRASGHRLTVQRELVLEGVNELGHATPDQVFHHVRSRSQALNLSTVYRALEVLEDLGLIRHAHLSDRAPTYHSVHDHEHFHLVCRNCGRVVSVDPGVVGDLDQRLAEQFGFVMDVGHLTVFGQCRRCEPDTTEATEPHEPHEPHESSSPSTTEEHP